MLSGQAGRVYKLGLSVPRGLESQRIASIVDELEDVKDRRVHQMLNCRRVDVPSDARKPTSSLCLCCPAKKSREFVNCRALIGRAAPEY